MFQHWLWSSNINILIDGMEYCKQHEVIEIWLQNIYAIIDNKYGKTCIMYANV